MLENGNSKIIKLTDSLQEILGITVSRRAFMTFKIHGKEYSIEKLLDQLNIGIRNWYLVGPFDFNPTKKIWDYHFEPEKDKVFNLNKTYFNKSDSLLKWQKVVSTSDAIDIRQFYDFDNSIAYAVTNLYSESDQPVKFIINSDDGNEFWLNGRKIHSINIMRGLLMGTDIVNANLKKGDNMLMMKISQGSGGWAFQVKAETPEAISNNLEEQNRMNDK